MKVRQLAALVVGLGVLLPVPLGGVEYLRLVLAHGWWFGGCVLLGFVTTVFVMRLLAQLALRTPGAGLKAAE